MPRVTDNQYLMTHDRLRGVWLRDAKLFAELSPRDQWALHDFFLPDRHLSDLRLLQYRVKVTAEHPGLPQRAGRALSRFWETTARVGLKRVRTVKVPATGRGGWVRQQDRRLTAKPLAHPELDTHKLARAFIHLAQDIEERRRGETQAPRSRP